MSHVLTRTLAVAALGLAGAVAVAGPAAAATSPIDSPHGSTDPADYNSEGVENRSAPSVEGGLPASALEQGNGFALEPVAGLLGGNLPIP